MKSVTLIPGKTKLNLHACYAEKGGRKIDRDAYTIAEFSNWLEWARSVGLGLDFNPTFFTHSMMDGDFSLSSFNETKREFWVEHGNALPGNCGCVAKGTAAMHRNYWMPEDTRTPAWIRCVSRIDDAIAGRNLFAPRDGARVLRCGEQLFGSAW
jgi:L-rhamnose isomerase